jgi:hypothetical protein
MTVETTSSKVIWAGNGATTVFSYSFEIDAASDIVLTYTDAAGNVTTVGSAAWSVTGIGTTAGGTLTYPLSGSPIAVGTTLTLQRIVPLTQPTDLTDQGGLWPTVVMDADDNQEFQIQQVSELASRALVISVSETGPVPPLPPAVMRASQYLTFDSAGNPTVGAPVGNATVSAPMLPVIETPSVPAALALLLTGQTALTFGMGNIAALRALATLPAPAVYVLGYYVPADSGAGTFFYNSADTVSADNGGTIIVDAAGHRWYRQQESQSVSAAWFGCKGDGTTNDAANLAAAATVAADIVRALVVAGTSGMNLSIGTNAALAVPLDFTAGGMLSPTVGIAIAITGAVIAGAATIFAGAGTVTLALAANVEALAAWWGAVGDNATNNAPFLNAAILSLHNGANAGGRIRLGAGTFLATATITVKGATVLVGAGRDATLLSCGTNNINLVSFDATSSYGGMRDIFVTGNTSGSATMNLVQFLNGSVGGSIEDCNIWGGYSALFAQGTDWNIDNCFIAGWAEACLSSNGANWYRRCKFDSAGAGTIPAAYLQGTYAAGSQVCENHFEQCDFSGSFTNSVLINDSTGTEAITTFTGCVFSAGIVLSDQIASMFVGCEFGSVTFTLSSGAACVTGSYAFASMSPAGVTAAGNINFT